MTVQFSCPKCAQNLRVSEELIGRKGRCTQCGTPVTVPDPAEHLWPPGAAPKRAPVPAEEIELSAKSSIVVGNPASMAGNAPARPGDSTVLPTRAGDSSIAPRRTGDSSVLPGDGTIAPGGSIVISGGSSVFGATRPGDSSVFAGPRSGESSIFSPRPASDTQIGSRATPHDTRVGPTVPSDSQFVPSDSQFVPPLAEGDSGVPLHMKPPQAKLRPIPLAPRAAPMAQPAVPVAAPLGADDAAAPVAMPADDLSEMADAPLEVETTNAAPLGDALRDVLGLDDLSLLTNTHGSGVKLAAPPKRRVVVPTPVGVGEVFRRTGAIYKRQLGSLVGFFCLLALIYLAEVVSMVAVSLYAPGPLQFALPVILQLVNLWLALGALTFLVNTAQECQTVGDLFNGAGSYLRGLAVTAMCAGTVAALAGLMWISGFPAPSIGALVAVMVVLGGYSLLMPALMAVIELRLGPIDALRWGAQHALANALPLLTCFAVSWVLATIATVFFGIGLLFAMPYAMLLPAVLFVRSAQRHVDS